jgi:hypothetical protein
MRHAGRAVAPNGNSIRLINIVGEPFCQSRQHFLTLATARAKRINRRLADFIVKFADKFQFHRAAFDTGQVEQRGQRIVTCLGRDGTGSEIKKSFMASPSHITWTAAVQRQQILKPFFNEND